MSPFVFRCEYPASNIKEVNLQFTPGTDFVNMRSLAEFNPVTTRKVQKATLAAVKKGADTLDLAALRPVSPGSDESMGDESMGS